MINIKDIIIFPQGVPSTLLHTFKTFSIHCQVNFNFLLLILRKVLTVQDDDDDHNQDGPDPTWSNKSAHPAPERPGPRVGGAASARLPNPA